MERILDRVGKTRAVLIAGPTASGKSAAALLLAEAAAGRGREAVIINADSMQVYAPLTILTARPDAAAQQRAPHLLYGHVPGDIRYSVGLWLQDASACLRDCEGEGTLPVFVGGTGLYFKALTEGLVATPAIPAEVLGSWISRLASEGAPALHDRLSVRDPAAAAAIRPSDPQRLVRALAVLDATGTTPSEWRARGSAPPLVPGATAIRIVVEADRAALYDRIDARFERMIAAGAVEEVASLLQAGIRPDLPVMKAIGVRELAAVLRDECSLATAAARAKQETRRFAKRQMTWFRNQMPDWDRLTL